MTLIEGVEVLSVRRPPAVNERSDGGLSLRSRLSAGSSMITVFLAVTPEQANKLQAVKERGEISLVSRPKGETSIPLPSVPVTLEDVLGIGPRTSPSVFVTEIYRGGSRSTQSFQGDELLDAGPQGRRRP